MWHPTSPQESTRIMGRPVPTTDESCDNCGATSEENVIYDFMGDYLCCECAESPAETLTRELRTQEPTNPVEHPMFCVFHDRIHQTFLEVFFTREAAEKWMEEGKHLLKDPWIYVKGSHNNQQWRDACDTLIGKYE